MTNHQLLAFIYHNSPCSWIDIEFEFGCSESDIALRVAELMIGRLVEYNRSSMLFFYREDAWLP